MTLGWTSDGFLGITPKAGTTKVKINKLNFITIKNIYVSKDTMNKVKNKPTEWKKIFINYI